MFTAAGASAPGTDCCGLSGFCRRACASASDGTGCGVGATLTASNLLVSGCVLVACPPPPRFPATFFVSTLLGPLFAISVLLVTLCARRKRRPRRPPINPPPSPGGRQPSASERRESRSQTAPCIAARSAEDSASATSEAQT